MTLKFPFRDSSGEEFVGGVALDITEREQAEQALRATTRLLESIVQSAPVAIATFDREGRVTRWNDAATRIFGWPAAEVHGRFNPLLPESERDGFLEMLSLACKRAERRLAAQHAVARALAESTTLDEAAPRILEEICGALDWELGGLWTVDPRVGRLRLASIWHAGARRFERFVDESWALELDRGEGFPGAVWEAGETRWFADVAVSSRSRTAAVASAGLHGALAAPIVGGGEVLGVLELFTTRVWEPDDELVAMLTSVRSQVGQFLRRAQSDREVREREERFRTLVANLPGAIYRCAADEDWTMSFLSDVIREITGYPASDFIDNAGRSFASVIHRDDLATVGQVVGEAVRRKEPFELEYRIVHADGSERWVAERGQPMIGPGGAVFWLDGAIFDVTEQHETEAVLANERELMARTNERLRELDRMKDEFVALVSHELRTPLTFGLAITKAIAEAHGGSIDVRSRVGAGTTFVVVLPFDPATSGGLEWRAGAARCMQDGEMSTTRLERLLRSAFPDATELEAVDRTGTGDHFQVVVTAPRFAGLSLVEQHRLVYDALAEPLADGTIHELRIKTRGAP